jgi:hypothetical protein
MSISTTRAERKANDAFRKADAVGSLWRCQRAVIVEVSIFAPGAWLSAGARAGGR